MAVYSHEVEVNVPIETIWTFIRNIDNWAPLVPGYMEHQILNDKESTWSFKSNIGIMKKKIELKVEITSWDEPSKVSFNLKGLNEQFSGSGYFLAHSLNESRTKITGHLNLVAEGWMAKIANTVLESSLPEMTSELTEAVTERIEEIFRTHSIK